MSSVQAIIIPKRVLDQDKEKKLRQILSKSKIHQNMVSRNKILKPCFSYLKNSYKTNLSDFQSLSYTATNNTQIRPVTGA